MKATLLEGKQGKSRSWQEKKSIFEQTSSLFYRKTPVAFPKTINKRIYQFQLPRMTTATVENLLVISRKIKKQFSLSF